MRVVLDGARILDRETLHDTLSEELELPEWYGRNLDALRDCLADRREDTVIEFRHQRELETVLGGYAEALFEMLRDVAVENSHIQLETEEREKGD